jgi:NADH-quinone oxidoreductase subunit J
MTILFLVAAAIAIAGTLGAMSLRNPIHCILSLAAGLVGIAGVYLALSAQFVGFTQVLVYVGAVAILAVFALMMTQSEEQSFRTGTRRFVSLPGVVGVLTGSAVFGLLAWAALSYRAAIPATPQAGTATAGEVGISLMHAYVVPLEVIGLLLTVALIGAVIVALPEKQERP